MAICNSDGEVIGVVQAINKNPMGTPFSEDDEKVKLYCAEIYTRYHSYCCSLCYWVHFREAVKIELEHYPPKHTHTHTPTPTHTHTHTRTHTLAGTPTHKQ